MLSLVLKRYYEPLRLPIRTNELSVQPYIHQLMALCHHPIGSPALHCYSSNTCHPCYPERFTKMISLSNLSDSGLLHMTIGSASPTLTRLHIGSLTLRPVSSPLENLQPLVTQTLLSGTKGAHEQLPLQDLNLLEQQLITAYGQVLNYNISCATVLIWQDH